MAKSKRIGSDPLDDLIPTGAALRKPSTVNRQPSTAPKRTAKKQTDSPKAALPDASEWEANNVRVTFYCPTSLLEEVEQEMARSKRSKTRVIVDAIRNHIPSR